MAEVQCDSIAFAVNTHSYIIAREEKVKGSFRYIQKICIERFLWYDARYTCTYLFLPQRKGHILWVNIF